MEIDTELQNLINEYVRQIENKEEDLVGLKRNIDGITSVAKQDLKNTVSVLDKEFDANEIGEEEYLTRLRTEKQNILNKTKEKLDVFLGKYEKIYNALNL